jgi:formylglycine-generating enzyme required for sulfatase activity
MATVYLALDVKLGRHVALKIPHFAHACDSEVLQRLAREARIAATLDHPNICSVYDVGRIDGIHFLAMAYIPGKPLSEFICTDSPLPQTEVAALVRKLAVVLQEAHEHGIVHRDLKPSNVMINQRGEPVIMDFGVAHDREAGDARLTPTGAMLGTPAYLSPEQFTGDLEAMGVGCDVYSLGVILYELLTGQIPFEGPPLRVLVKILTEEPQPPSALRPDVNHLLESICRKSMARSAADRYASMAEFADALGAWLEGERPASSALNPDPGLPQAPSAAMEPEQEAPTSPFSQAAPPAAVASAGKGQQTSRWLISAIAVFLGLTLGIAGSIWPLPNGRGHGNEAEPRLDQINLQDRDTPKAPEMKVGRQPDSVAVTTGVAPTLHHSEPQALEKPGQLKNSIGLRLVRIPAGKFWMGSPSDEADRFPDEGPRHELAISKGFFLGKYEVTQDQYRRVMGTNPSWFATGGEGAAAVQGMDTGDFPVENVSWEEAVEFCHKLSELPAEKQSGRSYELPSEAEWEYACRAGTDTAFHFGAKLDPKQANFAESFAPMIQGRAPQLRRTCRVGTYAANAWGLCDMHGNVREWCRDWYDRDYYSSRNNKDPQGPTAGQGRVLRGGSWDDSASSCRAAYRGWLKPESRSGVGFRVRLYLD